MHPHNSFITLTYDDNHVGDGRLHYEHFQKFMKRLRRLQNDPIGVFVTGEYGDKTKRPHWHAILFNYRPRDAKPKYETERGDQVWESDVLSKTWGQGIAEFGSVTFESAGYCARYAAKKLGHGPDQSHDFNPISKKSSKHAIGKAWLEKFWPDVFNHGRVILPNGSSCGIPRYYEKWLKENRPTEWLAYVTRTKTKIVEVATAQADREQFEYMLTEHDRRARGNLSAGPTRRQTRKLITELKFKQLQEKLKL